MNQISTWSVYIIRCSRNSFYTGIATDVERRVQEHENASSGAKYLRGRGPLTLVFQREVGDRSLASKLEHRIKRLSRVDKEALVKSPNRLEALMPKVDSGSSDLC